MTAALVAVAPLKTASALELIPGKSRELCVAPNVAGKAVEVVAHASWPF